MLVSALLFLTVTACGRTAVESPLVASVYNYELHQSDLDGLVGEGLSADDSAAIVDNYIGQWVRQRVMLAKAEKNVKEDFSRQMNEYHNSLMIYAYERQILDQLLDTVVTDEQIAEYYEGHKDEFLLKGSIVKAVYVMAPYQSNVEKKIKALVGKHDFAIEDVVELEALASRNSLKGYYDADTWIPFYTLQTAVPITTYNENLYLKQNRYISLHDDSLSYHVRVLDYKLSDELSPIDLQRDNIRAIILNHRRNEVLSRLQADLMAEAEKGGHVRYNNTTI